MTAQGEGRGNAPEAGRRATETRDAFIRLSAQDVERLKALSGFAETHVDDIIEGLYEHLLSFEATRRFFPDEATLDRVRRLQREYFLGLTSGEYGDSYVARRRAVGITHDRIGLAPEWYLGTYCYYLTAMLDRLRASPRQTVDGLTDAFTPLLKRIFHDMVLSIDAFTQPTEEFVTRMADGLASVGDGVCIIAPDGTIQFANNALRRILGYDEGELVSANVSRLYPGGADDPILETIAEGIRAGGWRGEVELQAKDGSLVATLESAQPLNGRHGEAGGCVCTYADIRDRKRTEKALQQSEEQTRARSEELHALLNVASVLSSYGAFAEKIAGALEEVMTISETSSAHLRVPDESTGGLRLIASIGLGVEERAQGVVRETRSNEAFERGEPIIANDYGVARRTGARKDVSSASGARSAIWLPLKSEGRTVGVISVTSLEPDHFTPQRIQILTAISSRIGTFVENANLREAERLRVEELETALKEVRSAQQQLIQAEKLAAVGTLISGIAHEVNNPLNNILGRVQLLQREAADDRSKRDLQTVRDECERAIRIVRNLLAFTREHKPEMTLVSLNDILDEVLELRAYELRVSNIVLHKDLQPDLPEISADPHQLQQVFLNLIINAEQAMAAAQDRGALSVTTQRVGDALQVVVTDDGPGIPGESISQIFDPFFTTKKVGAGTGLGLSVCYGIVNDHGGEIRVESAEGKGATFTVELPLPPRG